MRYVVVTVADGEAGVFNKKLSAEAFEKFKVKSSKLPAHITLKAPFETEEPIEVLEEAIEKYIKDKKAIPYEIKGFEHFDNRVIYMNVIENKEMRDFHKGFVKAIKEVNYISFGSHEGENAIFLFEIGDFSPIQKVADMVKENNYTLMNSLKFNEVDWTVVIKKSAPAIEESVQEESVEE